MGGEERERERERERETSAYKEIIIIASRWKEVACLSQGSNDYCLTRGYSVTYLIFYIRRAIASWSERKAGRKRDKNCVGQMIPRERFGSSEPVVLI